MSIEAILDPLDAKGAPPHGALKFETIRSEESTLIARARESAGAAPEANPIALCLSGGGIRSAVFSLGCLQALDEQRKLRYVD